MDKIVKFCFFTFYYPPDLSAGSFRTKALVENLIAQMNSNDSLVVITTSPNRYRSYEVKAETLKIKRNLKIYRISLPKHTGSMISQAFAFSIYSFQAIKFVIRRGLII